MLFRSRLCFGAITYMEAAHIWATPWFQQAQLIEGDWVTSTVRFLTAAALIWMCVTGRWGGRPDLPSANAPQPGAAAAHPTPRAVTPPAVTPGA